MQGAALQRPAQIVQALSIALALSGLIYRSTVYWLIPVMDGEPYGLGDVLELVFAGLLLLICSVGGILAVVGLLQPRLLPPAKSAQLILVSICSFGGYWLLHPLMPRLIGP